MLDVTSMLRNVMARNEHVRVTTVGVKLDLDPDRYTHVRRLHFSELSKFLARLDIGIAPIADHPMSYARSNIKVKEYAGAGVPWVASARGSYAGLGTKQGGITVADDGWEQALLDLAGSRLKRLRLRRKAESWGKSQHIKHHTQPWEAVMQRAVELAAHRA
jgi:glycosyltransferase involved in cell wall biosynthesis